MVSNFDDLKFVIKTLVMMSSFSLFVSLGFQVSVGQYKHGEDATLFLGFFFLF